MPVTVGHNLSATTPDNPAYEIRPSHWNDTHQVTFSVAASEISGLFSNDNGVSWGTTAGKITASFSTLAAATNVNDVGSVGSTGTSSAYAPADHVHAGVVRIFAGSNTGNTAGDTVGKHGNWVIAGSNNITINGSTGAGTHTAWVSGPTLTQYLTTAAQSDHSHGNPQLNLTNISGTTASNSGGFTLSLSAAAPGAGGGIAAAAGTQTGTSGTVLFQSGNGITFGMSNNSVITASHNGLTTARASNDAVGLNTALTAGPLAWTVNSGGVSLNAESAAGTTSGFGGNLISGSMTHNTAGLNLSVNHPAWLTTAAQSGHSHGNPTLALTNLSGTTASASNGFTLSLSAAAAGPGGGVTASYHAIPELPINTNTVSFGQSTSFVAPFENPQYLSVDRLRMIFSGSVAASSTQATTGNVSYSMSAVTSHNVVFYSRGAGANSLSLQYVTSTQHVDRQLVTISFAANSTQMSYSNRFTLGDASFTKDYSSSAASINYHTSNLTDLTGMKYIDVLAGLSLSPGQYWIAYGRSTTAATQTSLISVATRMLVSHNSMIAVSHNTLALGMLGGNTNSSVGWMPAHGSFTTAGGGTTSSMPMANVSTLASNNMLYIQMMRIT